MRMARASVWITILLISSTEGFAQSTPKLTMQVVDVGAGLCCILKTPDNHYMVYDAGNYRDRGLTAMTALRNAIPYGSTIDLLVLSHCDADHIAAVPFVCEKYVVKVVWRDGFDSGRDTWHQANQAVRNEAANAGCRDRNLQHDTITPGTQVAVGSATATFVCGFKTIPDEWGLSEGENRNARSVVVRVNYGNSSILLCGDTVGRHIQSPANTCIAAEAVMVGRATAVPLVADVIVAPHHGANNASSEAFLRAVSPRYVIFSSGSDHGHPSAQAARRYLNAGVAVGNIYRTDRGDNEGSPYEWRPTSGASADPAGDDDLILSLARNGRITVQYSRPTVRWNIPHSLPMLAAPADAASAPMVELPAEIAKYVLDDSLWKDQPEDLEEHTLESAGGTSMDGTQPVATARCCGDRPARHRGNRCCRRRPLFSLFRR